MGAKLLKKSTKICLKVLLFSMHFEATLGSIEFLFVYLLRGESQRVNSSQLLSCFVDS